MAKYITNKGLVEEITKSQEKGRINDRVATYIMQLSERLSRKSNFAGYSYREEFEAEAILALTANLLKFDRTKSENAFSYATAIAWNAMLRVLSKERGMTDVRKAVAHEQGMAWGEAGVEMGGVAEYVMSHDPHDDLNERIHIGTRPDPEWKQVPGYPRVLCARDGRVIRNTGAEVPREGAYNQYVRLSGKRYPWSRVIAATWDDLPLEDADKDDASEWRSIDAEYRINSDGQVQKLTKAGAWRMLPTTGAPYFRTMIRGRYIRKDELLAVMYPDG